MVKALAALIVGLLLGVTGLGGVAYHLVFQPVALPEEGKTLRVEKGWGSHKIAAALAENGVIEHRELFQLVVKAMRVGSTFKAGKYRFKGELNLLDVIKTLQEGQVLLVEFSIPEGLNQWQISEKIAEAFEHLTAEDFEAELANPELLAKLPKEAKNVEGYLFPDTYSISEDATVLEIFTVMIDAFFEQDDPEQRVLRKDLGLSLHEMVTLASIIEKETGAAEERPHISSVFHNRLAKGMKLQTDPTVIYGMWSTYDGNIRKKDLQRPTPYNTYVIPGLPPGPIASPGRDSLRASVRPISTTDLYFVALGDGSGRHKFSKTLTEHNRAVRAYLKQLRRRRRSN